ncbi:ligand-binding sensor domain-containing protein [Acanthopleuribacter pedis]|uniref:histidine kinase n=1 Tax=Acanthopleuribacter pedis TaxID=442870 RepID=A0A8J7Q4Z8_9BACT|nr:sensor histidine kinase [Acanthopleuribacter pedis]MBO1317971.1 GHKL domain-containing protein [Acanthopleuribacter pedis]
MMRQNHQPRPNLADLHFLSGFADRWNSDKTRRRVGLWLALMVFLAAPLWAQKRNLRNYSTDEGLPQSQALCLFQDKLGFLWVGTYSGLSRYDGSRFKNYTKEDGLSRNYITQINRDNLGRLVAGTRFGLNVYQDGRFTIYPGHPFWRNCNVNDMLLDSEGRLWVAATQGLAMIQNGVTYILAIPATVAETPAFRLYQLRSGRIIVATTKRVFQIVDNQLAPLIANIATPFQILALGETLDGRLLVGSDRGLFVLENEQMTLFTSGETIFDMPVTKVLSTQEGMLWVGTRGQGVVGLRQSDGTVFLIDKKSGLINASVAALLQDREGNLWIGNDAMLTKYTPGPFSVFSSEHGLGNDFVRAIFKDHNDLIWLGTRNGVTTMTPDYQFTPRDDIVLPSPRVFSISGKKDGTMFFATYAGLTIVKDGVSTAYNSLDGLRTDYVRSVYTDSKERVWINTLGLGLWQGEGKVSSLPEGHPLHLCFIYDMIEDAKGWLWLATGRGLIGYEPDSEEVVTFDAFNDVTVWSVDMDREGVIWAASNGYGLLRVENQKMTRLSTENGLTSIYGWQIKCASDGSVWYGHNRGLDRLIGGRIEHYDTLDGIAENEGTATATMEDTAGNVLFGSSEGISRFNPSEVHPRTTPPTLYLEQVMVDDIALLDQSEAVVPRDMHQMVFTFAAPHFAKEETLRFRWRMLGLDPRWAEYTEDYQARYFKLPAGNYTFEVQAHADYKDSNTVRFSFQVPRIWWQKPIYAVFIVLLVIGTVVTYTRIHVFRLAKQQQALEQLVDERTSELQTANADLFETHQRLVETAHRAGMAEIATGILHNVGNILNSINVSVEVMDETVRKSNASGFMRRLLEVIQNQGEETQPGQNLRLAETLEKTMTLMERNQSKVMKEVNALKDQIHHINEIVRTQQSYAKIEYYERMDPNIVVMDALRILRNMFRNRSIELIEDLKPLPFASVAKIKLMQVVINVLKNAIEATEKNPIVVERVVSVWTDLNTAGEIEIHIKDAGSGISDEKAQQIFSYGYTTKRKGHGFGLHYCANAMTEMGGSIAVRNNESDKGTTFTLRFPIHRQEARGEDEETA